MADTTLLLVRHGATEHNLSKPYVLQGRRMDPPLADAGRRQIAALADALNSRPIAAVFSSQFRRARETAALLAAPYGVPCRIIDAIGEIDIGTWEGLSWDQIHSKYPAQAKAFEEDCSKQGYLGGENYTQLAARVVPALESLRGDFAGKTIAVVGHNGVNRAAICHWLGIPLGFSRRIPQANGCYNVVLLSDAGAKVQTINVVDHLAGVPGLD